ncbi:hypothetical protein AND_002078 [Anopheles darlingi]|uniref:Peptidase S1 domain-containing protein n=1 Tax=Anopheles darlingi TaxID=43151 RepID=W5JPT1_ANODA|nr:serine protease grass-like [Anopheles darlingi]ETN66141.1 hypothetical protein AND_002078 [Anopheles darlingi]
MQIICILAATLFGVNGQLLFPDDLHSSLSKSINKKCGETPYDYYKRPASGRIYENPWLVLLRHPGDWLHFCHGTLITDRFVLTTASCGSDIVTTENSSTADPPTEIVLGEHDLSTDPDCVSEQNCSLAVQIRTTDSVILHPNFTSTSYENDIALLVLNASVEFSNSIRPICLPLYPIVTDCDDHLLNLYNVIWATGSRPTQIWMRLVPREVCRERLRNWTSVRNGQICARIHNSLPVDMKGSAGSALQIDYHGRIYQIGVLSVGFSDTSYDNPYIFIDIPKHITWINDST